MSLLIVATPHLYLVMIRGELCYLQQTPRNHQLVFYAWVMSRESCHTYEWVISHRYLYLVMIRGEPWYLSNTTRETVNLYSMRAALALLQRCAQVFAPFECVSVSSITIKWVSWEYDIMIECVLSECVKHYNKVGVVNLDFVRIPIVTIRYCLYTKCSDILL